MRSVKNEKLKLDRQKIQLIIGNFVKYENQIYKITQLIDFNEKTLTQTYTFLHKFTHY